MIIGMKRVRERETRNFQEKQIENIKGLEI